MIRIALLAAFYASFWANMPGYGRILQSAFLPLFFTGSLVAMARKKLPAIAPSGVEIALYASAIISVGVCICRTNDDLTLYSITFLAALIVISAVSRASSLDEILDTGAVATLLGLATCLLWNWRALNKALSISYGMTGLFRFSPLSTGADLVGFIFGSCSILMARRAFLTKRPGERVVMILGVMVAWIFLLAASARASLLSLTVASIAALILEIRPSRSTYWKMASIGAVLTAFASLVFAKRLLSYVQGILEINTRTRGLASGGTGRTELWLHGVSEIFSDPIRLIFGGGLRSSEFSYIGFFTENSYVSIFLDSGIFLGTAIVCGYIYAAIKGLKLSRTAPPRSSPYAFVGSYFIFLVLESFFNRYLLALGNAGSLLAIVVLISLSIVDRPVKQRAVKPDLIRPDIGGAASDY